jgi:uncharacterized membrane protein
MSHPEAFAKHKKNVNNTNLTNKTQLKLSNRVATYLTIKVGSMTMLSICALLILVWIVLNQVILKDHAFDPYPFAFLLTCINFVQLLLMPLIMIGQNIQGQNAELRAEKTYKNSIASYHDAEAILKILAAQEAMLVHQTRILVALHEKNSK